MKVSHHFVRVVLVGVALAASGVSQAACPADATSLASEIKVRDPGVLAALRDSIPGQIRKAGGAARYAGAIEALKLESIQQRDQWKRTAQSTYGGAGNALAWPNGCSWPASGTYCNALA